MIRVTVWNENIHEKEMPEVARIYPQGIHGAVAQAVGALDDVAVRTVTLDMPEHGLTQEVLDQTDVLFWWAHCAHGQVSDEAADRVAKSVLNGMGLVVLHSAHNSKPFLKLLGTSGSLKWREIGEKERVWTVDPSHPIAQGLDEHFELPHEEMYGEPFGIPQPDELVFLSWFAGGEVFRSGCCFRRGMGKIFYFRPGHETFPTYFDPNVVRVLQNAARWAAPQKRISGFTCPQVAPLEQI